MGTFVLRRKTFTYEFPQPQPTAPTSSPQQQKQQNQQKKGMSTGAKVGLGIGGTLLVGAGTFEAARRGKIGPQAAKYANQAVSKVGGWLKKAGMNKFGTRMENSGNFRASNAIKEIGQKANNSSSATATTVTNA